MNFVQLQYVKVSATKAMFEEGSVNIRQTMIKSYTDNYRAFFKYNYSTGLIVYNIFSKSKPTDHTIFPDQTDGSTKHKGCE